MRPAGSHWARPRGRGTRRTSARTVRSTGSRRPTLLRACLIDGERPSLEILAVIESDGFLSLCIVRIFDKCETAFSSGLAIKRHEYVQDISRTSKMGADFFFGCLVGKVPNKK